jgi:hypothetical protein
VPHLTKSALLDAFDDISLIVGNSINVHENWSYKNTKTSKVSVKSKTIIIN